MGGVLPDVEHLTNGTGELLAPGRVWSRSEMLSRNSPVPKLPGVYAWYFRELPPEVSETGCVIHNGLTLLYVGISPTKRRDALPHSRQSLSTIIRYHFQGNARRFNVAPDSRLPSL
jgi:hypothetical protein